MTSTNTKHSTSAFSRTFPDQRPPASGLFVSSTRTSHLFKELSRGPKRERVMTVGSSPHCNLQLIGDKVERVHVKLKLKRKRGRMTTYLLDQSPKHNTFVDGWQSIEPVPLLVGMVIEIGGVQLVATDHRGKFKFYVESVSDLCRQATKLCGSYRAAGRQVGRSYNFVRRQSEPRSERFEKKTKK